MRKYNHLVRCVKGWNDSFDGWWGWCEAEQYWKYIEEDKVEWVLSFLSDETRPTMDQIRAEA